MSYCLTKPLDDAVAVDLWDESISDAGVAALAASLPQSQLRVLGLWGTPFTDGNPGNYAARVARHAPTHSTKLRFHSLEDLAFGSR